MITAVIWHIERVFRKTIRFPCLNYVCFIFLLISTNLELRSTTINDTGVADFSTAITNYHQRLELAPESGELHLQLAQSYTAVEDFENALTHYHYALELNPNLEMACYGLGAVYSQNREFRKAIQSYQQAVSLQPSMTQLYVELGYAYSQLYQFPEAITAYQKAIEQKPNWGEPSYHLGTIFAKQGLIKEALQHLNRAILLEEHLPATNRLAEAYYQKGNLLVKQKKLQAATKAYQVAIQYKPVMGAAHYNLAKVYFRLSQSNPHHKATATQHLNIAERLKVQAKDIEEKRDIVDRSRGQDQAAAFSNLAQTYLKYGAYQQAVESYRKSIWRNPNLAEAHSGLGLSYLMLERYVAAVAAQEKAIALKPDLAQAHAALGLTYLRQSKSKKAIKYYQRAITLQPKLVEAQCALAEIYFNEQNYQAAEKHYQNALLIQSQNTQALIGLAKLYGRDKIRLDQALEVAEKAVKIQPSAPHLNILSWIYHRKGEYRLATKSIQRAIDLDPSNTLYQRGLKQIQKSIQNP